MHVCVYAYMYVVACSSVFHFFFIEMGNMIIAPCLLSEE